MPAQLARTAARSMSAQRSEVVKRAVGAKRAEHRAGYRSLDAKRAERVWCWTLQAALAEDVHDERDLGQEVAGQQARIAKALRDPPAGCSVYVDAGDRGRVGIGALRH